MRGEIIKMDLDLTQQLEEYVKIKKMFDKFRELRGDSLKKNPLTINVEEIKRNVRKSLVVKKYNGNYLSRILRSPF